VPVLAEVETNVAANGPGPAFLYGVALPVLLLASPAGSQEAAARAFAAARFSALDEIDAGNVSHLEPAFFFRLPPGQGHSRTPQIAGHTLFVMTPFPHKLYALALDGAAAGSVRWSYTPHANRAAAGLALDNAGNCGPMVSDDSVYLNTLDGQTIAISAQTGEVLWEIQSANTNAGETLTSPPLVVGDSIIIGSAGDSFGARGWIKALDRKSGRELWRRYSTGPDAEVGIGPSFRPLYQDNRGTDLGVSTWPPLAWQHGGGSVSGLLSYDPELDLVFHGTGPPAPGNPDQRPGDNKWTAGLFARDAGTGSARWFVPVNPHDLYGLGATAANVLTDRDWRGAKRQLLIHPDGNGYIYVLDRRAGEILAAQPFGLINATTDIDIAEARPRRNAAKVVRADVTTRDICPAWPGAVSAGASAFSSEAGLLYIPTNFICMDLQPHVVSFIPGTPFTGTTVRINPIPGQPPGALLAWDIAATKAVWQVPEQFPIYSGVLTTAGHLVFYGTLDGWFKAVEALSGQVLWQFRAGSRIIGQPISYLGADGHQYVAVLAGSGGPLSVDGHEEIDTRDTSAGHGFANALSDLPRAPEGGGMLYAFRLP
jgi:lanthanide-dependent methanol dehydrogenase